MGALRRFALHATNEESRGVGLIGFSGDISMKFNCYEAIINIK